MGDPLAPAVLRGFCFELTKLANKPPFFSGLYELAGRLGTPIQGLKKGWKLMSPTEALRAGAEYGGTVTKGLRSEITDTMLAAARKGTEGASWRDSLKGAFGAGAHLAPGHAPGQGLSGLAERASRGGWTGQSAATKYLPIGERSMVAAGGLGTLHSVGHALRSKKEGESGVAERGLGGLAGLGTGIATFGTGGYGMMLPIAADVFGSRLGRKIDKGLQRGHHE